MQVMHSYRDDKGKPTNQSLGVVGVFDEKIKPELAQQLTKGERDWLRGEMEKAAAVCVVESREVLERLASRVDQITDGQLCDAGVYRAVFSLAEM